MRPSTNKTELNPPDSCTSSASQKIAGSHQSCLVGNFKKLYLGGKLKNRKRQFAMIDKEDYSRFSKFSWSLQEGVNTTYAVTAVSGSICGLHRLVMNLDIEDPREVDHRNHNGLDNRKCNLRVCTRSENMMNRYKSGTNISGFKGVSYSCVRKKWRARINVDGKEIYLGCFSSEVIASKVYNLAAKKYFKEFACLNKI
ncbi:MAG: HNH endonuclease [Lutibacter sp.]|jgi:hypothetical protein